MAFGFDIGTPGPEGQLRGDEFYCGGFWTLGGHSIIRDEAQFDMRVSTSSRLPVIARIRKGEVQARNPQFTSHRSYIPHAHQVPPLLPQFAVVPQLKGPLKGVATNVDYRP